MDKKKHKREFTYAVGHYWKGESGQVGCYAYGNELFYGTMKDAKKFLKYVESKSPEKEWCIFQLIEVPT